MACEICGCLLGKYDRLALQNGIGDTTYVCYACYTKEYLSCPTSHLMTVPAQRIEVGKDEKLEFHGINKQAAEALRYNEGKVPMAYVPMDLLDGAAKVMAYGAKKYGDSENFRKGYSDLLSPLSSVMRHLVEVQRAVHTKDVDNSKGHLLDSESGEAHVHHLITSVMMLIHSMRLQGYKV